MEEPVVSGIATDKGQAKITVIGIPDVPGKAAEIFKVVAAAADFEGPMYIRLTGAVGNPPVYTEDYAFEIGKAVVLRPPATVTLVATGSMVHESLEAAKLLEEAGISAGVINMHTIKPLDIAVLDQAMSASRLLVTVEEHSVIGGLGSAVAEYKSAKRTAPPQLTLGLPDAFDVTGDYRFLLERHGLVAAKIAARVQSELSLLNA